MEIRKTRKQEASLTYPLDAESLPIEQLNGESDALDQALIRLHYQN
jgi:hypothetical protein